MKRLLVLLAGLAVGSAVNAAANVGWTITADGSMAGSAYQFFIITQNGADSITTVTDAIAAGNWDAVSGYAWYTGTLATSGSNATGRVNYTSDTALSLATLGEGDYEAFFIVYDSSTANGSSSYALVTSEQASNLTKTVGANTAGVTFSAANQTTYLSNSSNWVNIPEPTSGLMLLLGMAGLALKRKRA